MRPCYLPRRFAQTFAAGLLTLAAAATTNAVAAQGQAGVQTPPGWTMMPLPAIRGHIQSADTDDNVQLMYNDEQKLAGVVMVTFTPGGGYAGILKTFKYNDGDANPPRLSMMAPGDYLPACHPGSPCEKVHIANQAVALCFGEASCRILYYEGKELRDIVMTD
ncbi:hypothetical protein [Janthinobacterium sp. PC23-8]|uniref:hypothetical protein n=1 Tax=Janthinobacterium sp. PC23-8 TaxID=2012679 RepID=UPI000B9721F5|nr:hypothetical protein [Janthinobacterium sp. PC23-8]OYO28569.1 hypothetical protein CD932_15390 [Janthinobacterium sp. PC23-8]